MTPEQTKIINDYVDAFRLVHGYSPTVTYKSGWFTADGRKNRKSDMLWLTGFLKHQAERKYAAARE